MTRRCSTKIERLNMFTWMSHNWNRHDLLPLVRNAQKQCVPEERRTEIKNHSKACMMLYSVCLAAEDLGERIPQVMIDSFANTGKKLKGLHTAVETSETPASIVVWADDKPATVLKLHPMEIVKLAPHLVKGTMIEVL